MPHHPLNPWLRAQGMLGMAVNDTALRQTEAAIQRMQAGPGLRVDCGYHSGAWLPSQTLNGAPRASPHLQDTLGNVTLQSFNASVARMQLASKLMARARQRAAALNASATPLW